MNKEIAKYLVRGTSNTIGFQFQSEITNNLKDVSVQREQLYRMLYALKSQGIEIGPNMTVLKSDPLPSKTQIASDVIFYSEMSPSPDQIGPSPPNLSKCVDIFQDLS